MNCPGSIQLAKKLGATGSESGFAAKEGTAAHEVLAHCLDTKPMSEPWEFMGYTVTVEGEKFEVDQEMVDALNLCYNHIVTNMQEAERYGEVLCFIETSMKHSEHDLMFGTTDCGIVAFDRKRGKIRLWVNDLKYGAGVTVEPTSSQIKYYAELIVDRLIQEGIIKSHDDIESITLTIMQPRIPHADGLIRSIEMTGSELERWYRHELVPAMKETENPNALLSMGDWCTFCPVKSQCPAMAQAVLDLSTITHPEKMTGDELGDAINKIAAITKLGETLKEFAFKKAMAGTRVKGFKLVKKKANRVFMDKVKVGEETLTIEQLATAEFGDAAFSTPTLLSPPKIEDLPGGKTFVAKYAYQPKNTGLTLAPLSDSRKEFKSLMDMEDDIRDDL